LVQCVSYFCINAQSFGVLFFSSLSRLFPIGFAITPNQHERERRGGSLMNSFTLTAVGHLARNPELVAKGNTAYARFCLVGTDYAGKDEEGAAREVITTIWFVAFGALGEAVARHSRKGDQLFVEARVRANLWTNKQGEKQYDHSFVVQGFRFGAPGRVKRDERDARREDGHGLQRYEERPDGLGLRRSEERTNGRDKGGNGGDYSGVGAHAVFGVEPRSGADARVGPRTGVVLPAGATAGVRSRDGATYGRVGGPNGSARAREPLGAKAAVGGKEDAGTDGSADVSGTADGEAAGGDDESANAHDSADTGEFASANESTDAGELARARENAGGDEIDAGDKPSGTQKSASADESAGNDKSAEARETSSAGESDEADKPSGVSKFASSHESAGTGESVSGHESSGADESDGGESDAADESDGADESGEVEESTGSDRSIEAHGSARARDRASTAVKVATKESSKVSAKNGETGSKARANAGRAREKSGGARTGRRAPASAS
jgi:single-strand DNA-binding protein